MAQTVNKLQRMHGGLKLKPYKALSTRQPIGQVERPAELILPVRQHVGTPAEVLVSVGEHVDRGQPLARAIGRISASVHAPASGVVKAVSQHALPHPGGILGPCIILETDAEDHDWDGMQAIPDWTAASPETLRLRIQDAGIVGLGGAAFPTHVKLGPTGNLPVHTLILNGSECEPYISCDDMLLRERADQVVTGAAIMLRVLGAQRCVIALEEDKPEAFAALGLALANTQAPIEIVVVPAIYPQGGERQLIETITGVKVPRNGLPLDIGMVCQNVGTAAAIHRAVLEGVPLISRIVTVTGHGVSQPRNVEALLGTPIRHLIACCGGYASAPGRLRMGGPMMGFELSGDELPVVKATNCILVDAAEDVVPPPPVQPCIRCGECVAVCPEMLLPQQLHWYGQAKDLDEVEKHRLFDCIECGCCDVVCPSHIPLVDQFRWLKGEIRHRDEERRKAELAKRRFEARQVRLERERLAREERLKKKQDPQAIDEALARIKAKASE